MTMRSYEGTPAYLAGYEACARELADIVSGVARKAAEELDGDYNEETGEKKLTLEGNEAQPEKYGAFCALLTVLDMIADQCDKTALKYQPKGKEGVQ